MSFFVMREGQIEDIDEIVNLILTCFPDKFNVIFGKMVHKGKKALIEDLKTKKLLENFIVATYNGKIVGVLSLNFEKHNMIFLSTLKIFIKNLGLLKGIRAIFLGGFHPFSINKDSCFFEYLGVLPEFRRKKVGNDLMEYGEKIAFEKKKKYIFSFINPSNIKARQLVDKIGFEEKYVKNNIVSKIFFNNSSWIYLEKKLI